MSDSVSVTYGCATDTAANSYKTLPPDLHDESWRLRHLSYLKSTKTFRTPYDFYMSHYLLSTDPEAILPPFANLPANLTQLNNTATIQPLLRLPRSCIPFHSPEKIELEFNASQYFAFFNVRISRFDISDTTSELHPDIHLQGAAQLLQHCKHLTLHFSDAYKWAHAWSYVKGTAWTDAICCPRVCESGLLVD